MPNNDLSRRDFLLRVSALGAFAAGSSTLLSACGGGESGGGSGSSGSTNTPAAEPETQAAADCNDLSGLSDADRTASTNMRTTLQYKEVSEVDGSTCANCQLYTAPENGCGGCQLFAGPVTAEGWCASWSIKQA